ncbi:MAG: hydrogenase maturation protease, partial [Cyanobacteria bacterium NC_groundwater_1444_Ag_S-0.65um_54_12]|nr:hydrogenase maturation protease [Cyanobacteria bacterium NC_groundwater_1444_Ag_S-0.65um_54_12]
AWPEHVRIFDAGLAGIGALRFFEGCTRAIIVDAVKTGAPAGTVCRLDPAEIAVPPAAYSSHLAGVAALINLLPVAFEGSELPKLTIIGVEVEKVGLFSEQLTPPVLAALERMLAEVRAEVLESPG